RGHRADYGFIGTMDAKIRRQRAEEVYYDIRDVWVDLTEAVEEDRQTQLSQRVDVLVKDRQFHYKTARLLDQEALVSREAWAHSVGLSSAVHYELQAYRTHTQMQDYRIASQESPMTTLIAQAGDQTHADDHEGAGSSAQNNMPPRISFATARAATAAARAAATAAAATPMTAAAGDGSLNSDTGIRGTVRTLRECMYKDFLNCKPLSFKGTEGVVVLSQWFLKMESVFHISNCAVENQVKFDTCTFL
ncbi:hypothetical protein Tco_1549734, partial [Tanacetum coccineum]